MNKILRLFLFSVAFSLAHASSFGQCTATLTSSPGSVAQTICSGSAIVPIVYTTTGANGIGSLSNLPAGVTASWSSNTITISGTPTASGTFNYTVTMTGGCTGGTNTVTGSIVVQESAIGYANLQSPATSNICIGNNFTAYGQVYALGVTEAAGANGIITAQIGYNNSNTDPSTWPAGNWSNATYNVQMGNNDQYQASIGASLAAGTYYYTFRYSRNGCAYVYGGYSSTGGGAWNGTSNVNGVLTISANNTITLTSAAGTNAQTRCINTAITTITYATTGATGATVSGLPAGVSGSWSANVFTISGTPTASGPFNYTVTMTGGCTGGTNTASGSITVTPNNTIALTSAAETNAQTRCINTAITNITYATTTATGATVSGLPAGVSGSWSANVFNISGTPTASGTFNYTVTMTGGCTGGTNTASGSITVTPNNTIALTSAAGTNAQTLCINTAITNTTYATTGATGATASGLPAGVSGSWSANVFTISGTPTASGPFNYTVTMTGGCTGGTNTASGSITVTPNNTIALTSAVGTNAQTRCINTAITNITYATTTATGATVSGLPAGVSGSWSANVFTISGTPAESGTFNYMVTLTGGCTGGGNISTGTINVNPASDADVITSSSNTLCSALSPFNNSLTLNASTAIVGSTTWQSSNDNSIFTDFANNSPTASIDNLTTDQGNENVATYKYYRLKTVSGVCPEDFSESIAILIKPRPRLNSQNVSVCSGDIWEFNPMSDSSNIVPNNTLYTYTATPVGNVIGYSNGMNQPTIMNEISNQNYANNAVSYNITPSSDECLGSNFTISVSILRHPEIIASENVQVCQGESTDLFAVDLFNTPGTYFDWTLGDTESLNFPYIHNPTAEPDYSTEYIVRMFDPINSNCYSYDTVYVAVNPIPTFDIEGPQNHLCSGNEYSFQVVESIDVNNLIWSVSNAETLSSDANLLHISVNNPGSIIIQANSQSSAGCNYEKTLSLEVGQTPSPHITGNSLICYDGSPSSYQIQTSNDVEWSIINGELISDINSHTIEVQWMDSAYGTLFISEVNEPSGCWASDTLEIYFAPLPEIQLGLNDVNWCSGDQQEVFATTNSGETIFWNVYGAVLMDSDSSGALLDVNQSGDISIAATVYNSWGCNSTAQINLTVGTTPQPLIQGPDQACIEGQSSSYYTLSPGNILSWEITNGIIDAGNGTASISAIWNTPGIGQIVITETESSSGCFGYDTLEVHLSAIPEFGLVANDPILCSGAIINIQVQDQSDSPIEWNSVNADVINSNDSEIVFQANSPGIVTVNASTTNSAGCFYTNSIQLDIGQTPNVTITGPTVVCEGSYYQNYEVYNQYGNQLTWMINNGVITNGQGTTNGVIQWLNGAEGNIIVSALNTQFGCEVSDTLEVTFDGQAPPLFPVEMLGQNTTVLFCNNPNFDYYRWGYTSAYSGIETVYEVNSPYYEYSQLDLLNYYYWVEYGELSGCITRSYYNEPPIITNTLEMENRQNLHIFPNPFNDHITIQYDYIGFEYHTIYITNVMGEVVNTFSVTDGQAFINTSNYPSGIYHLHILGKDSSSILKMMKP